MATKFGGTSWAFEMPKTKQEEIAQRTDALKAKAGGYDANLDPRVAQRAQTSTGTYVPTSTRVTNNNPPSGGDGNAPVVTTGGSASVVSNPYESYMNKIIALEKQRLAEERARQEQIRQERIAAANKVKDARIKATNETYNNSMGNLNAATESSLRQAYIKHKMDEKNMPQQMQAFGMSGGATETTLANMKNAYGNNRTSIMNENLAQQRLIEQDRANAIAGAEADAANAHLDAVGDAANYEASAVRDYNNGLIKMYESALDKMPTYNNTSGATSQITKNPWYDVAVGYLEDGNDVNSVITALKEQGVSEDIIDAILYNWESTI